MRTFIISAILSSLFFLNQLTANVVKAFDLTPIEQAIQELDSNALVAFDVDFTLITPDSRVRWPKGTKYFTETHKKHQLSKEEINILNSIVMVGEPGSLVDEKILSILRTLHEKNIKTIALSAISTGKLGIIPDVTEWRYEQLASLGISFDWAFPETSIIFPEFQDNSSSPVFKKGILASANFSKGKVLVAFLRKIGWKPSKIIFVDDRKVYIDEIEKELGKEKIDHTSFYFTQAKDQPYEVDPLIATFQVEYLAKHKKWLNEEEAKDKLAENVTQSG